MSYLKAGGSDWGTRRVARAQTVRTQAACCWLAWMWHLSLCVVFQILKCFTNEKAAPGLWGRRRLGDDGFGRGIASGPMRWMCESAGATIIRCPSPDGLASGDALSSLLPRVPESGSPGP